LKRTVGNNEWLDIDVLDDYLEGKLDASMMHKVERISLEDPFVAQALAGLTEAKKRTQTLSFLQKQLQERIAEKPVERKMWRIASHRLSIAATAAVLFLTVSVLFWMRENYRQQQAELAANKAKNIEVNLKPDALAMASADTLPKTKTETLVDPKKVEQVLDKTVSKGSQIIAKNNFQPELAAQSLELQQKENTQARIKSKLNGEQVLMIAPSTSAPSSPVQALDSKVDDIQIQTSNAKVYKGLILDINGKPIPGAEIKMVGNDLRAITNISGEFSLPANKEGEKATLEVGSIGYAKKNVEVKANEKVNVQLEEKSSALSEVIVVKGAENTFKDSLTDKLNGKTAESYSITKNYPDGGWPAYEDYLKQNNKLFANGDKLVRLSFIIKENGSLADIKVLKGQTKEMNDEAVRLLKEGPKWQYNEKGNNMGSIYIKF